MSSTPDEGEKILRDEDQHDDEEHHEGRALEDMEADVPEVVPPADDAADDDYFSSRQDPFREQKNGHMQDEESSSSPPPERGDLFVHPNNADNVLSADGSLSTPDDTPSIRDSILSSPRSGTSSFRSPARRGSPSGVHRPFDLRFQSRLSSFNLSPLRPSSPAFLGSHSRQSSVASFGLQPPSEPDDTTSPWDVIRWTKYRKITGQAFSEIGKRNFGSPTCLAVADQVVVGTSKGIVLVFDHQQNHKAIIGSGTKAAESGAVTALAISADHTTIAVGHATGHLFTWELARPARPFLHIPSIDNSQAQARKGDGHISGSAIVHVGFLGYRHTALVSADDKGMAFSHLATRGMGAVARAIRTARILGRYPELVSRSAKPLKKSSVLAFSPLPLGNVEQKTDTMGLVAMLTPYLLVIVSTTPVAQTQHKAARPRDVAAHSAMTAALAWFPAIKLKSQVSETSKTKLVYAWSNVLTVLEVHEVPSEDDTGKEKPPELQFLARSRFQSDEAIVAVQWLNKSVMAVLTITQQLLIIEDLTMHVTEAFDLLSKNVYHTDLYSQQLQAIIEQLDEEDTSMHGVVADAFHMSFRAYKGRLFLLGFNDIWTGALTNWADRLLALMNIGDFIGAIRLATKYYLGEGEKATIGLPEEDNVRSDMVRDKLNEMMTASLKYAFGKNQQAGNEPIEKPQMIELADACIKACLVMEDQDFLFEEVFAWYDDNDHGPLFVDILEPYILDQTVLSIPPPALKTLIDHFAMTHTPSTLEEIICMLDTSTMDIDQVTSLCKRYNLYDAYIYVWTMALRDFETPLSLLLDFADADNDHANQQNGNATDHYGVAQKIFPYISFILTSRIYPTGTAMEGDDSRLAQGQVYDYFFSGKSTSNGVSTAAKLSTRRKSADSFENLSRILHFDAGAFIAAMNEAFEDSFLNSSDADSTASQGQQTPLNTHMYTRQYIVRIMLEVMSTDFDPVETIYLDMFIARNLAKYPQYIVLSGTVLQEIFNRLCQYPEEDMRDDAQLSIEYLLSVFQPPSILSLVPLLQQAGFYRVLKSVFKQEGWYSEMVHTFFLDDEDQQAVFPAILACLRSGSSLTDQQRHEVRKTIEEHISDLISIDISTTATTLDAVPPDMHRQCLQALANDSYGQYEYLKTLLEPEEQAHRKQNYDNELVELYVRLLCEFEPAHVKDYIENVKEGDIRLGEVLPTIEDSGIIDAVVILQVRQGHVKEAMDRLTRHLSFLSSTLKGLAPDSLDQRDDASIKHSATDLLETINKYALVGVWLCQGQMKNAPKPAVSKSPKRAASAARPLSFEEALWLDLVLSVVSIARESSFSSTRSIDEQLDETQAEVTTSLRNTIQQVFTALLTSTTSMRDGAGGQDMMFLRILRAFLTQAARASPSLSELRSVIASIFSAYAYEQSILSLSNAMLDKDVFVQLDDVSALRQRGWRPRGQVCEVCRRRVWGPGIGSKVWEEWQRKERARLVRRRRAVQDSQLEEDDGERGKGKAAVGVSSLKSNEDSGDGDGDGSIAEDVSDQEDLGPIVIFSCRHLYHQTCLGQVHGEEGGTREPVCPACV
ncbi:Vacuolar protein sorting-associated protein 8 [Elasticomyces elasticus]|uniref:Vacuolar protein sorting-associated protein 8 n=1 Tax=Exophiala sideris TaxID=1016849 RepID=A0ABR0IVD1_9EURO|nr:Vacuolar protein sorting-associated protein 8 [Elasticomyces elasticus]KAK5021442.1 Vacuolar protein sorting-associated protein 8 [Exophiala sideris]KAK5025440.1 Vacuolar protein sorting-associated protein 8 [Exophiala sideris]KAK5049291.1 Vacuolar protein sorting-associated protein 8 [Exophiala sideris]KAK5176964.1 Vacuolar protein sorting-associated protein 8 [Eurotiomycetes sp. CCFEE 6388]